VRIFRAMVSCGGCEIFNVCVGSLKEGDPLALSHGHVVIYAPPVDHFESNVTFTYGIPKSRSELNKPWLPQCSRCTRGWPTRHDGYNTVTAISCRSRFLEGRSYWPRADDRRGRIETGENGLFGVTNRLPIYVFPHSELPDKQLLRYGTLTSQKHFFLSSDIAHLPTAQTWAIISIDSPTNNPPHEAS